MHPVADPGLERLRPPLLGVVALSALAFLALALLVGGGPLAIDTSVADALRPLHAGVIGLAIDAMNLAGQTVVWESVVGGLAAVLWVRGYRFEAVLLVVGLIGAEAGATAAKILVGRARPGGVVVTDLVTQASFPSGHVTRTIVTAGLLVAIRWPWLRRRGLAVALAAVVVVLMGISRIAVGEHWFTDVVGAVLFGVFALAAIGLVIPVIRGPRWVGPSKPVDSARR